MSDGASPEPDRLDGAPHPRQTLHLYGQGAAEAEFLTAFTSGRLHQGWLMTGPRGVGKATLAWRIARFLLATPEPDAGGLFGAPPPPASLDISPDHPVAHRVAALSEPGLFLLRRGAVGQSEGEREKAWEDGRFSAVIRVDEVRKLAGFLHLSATDGGRRVVIVDAADDMNTQAANAILKLLEEPPARTTLLLVCHQPARLLPTIRSRCRTLRLGPLGADDMQAALAQAGAEVPPGEIAAIAELAGGSVGAALHLLQADGLALYGELLGLLGGLPALDRPRLLALADSCAARGQEARRDLTLSLCDTLAARLARAGVTGMPPDVDIVPGEGRVLAALAPDLAAGRRWAERVQEAGERARHARAVNIDTAQMVTDLVLTLARGAPVLR